MTRFRASALLVLTAALGPFAAGCGGHVEVSNGGGAQTGGTGGTAGTGGAGTGGAGGTTSSCDGLVVQPTFVLPPVNAFVSKPRTALLPGSNDVLLTNLAAAAGPAGVSLFAGRLVDAFGAWPPPLDDVAILDKNLVDYELGPGPEGPVALTQHDGGAGVLFEKVLPEGTVFDAPINGADEALFVTAIEDRWFFAQASLPGPYYVLEPGSYQPASLPQSEDPLFCTTTPMLGAGVRSGQGFLAAFTRPNSGSDGCDPQAPKTGAVAEISRYDSPSESGSFLERTASTQVAGDWDSFAHLAMAEASFGGWLVYQFAGDAAFTPPPVVAMRLDETGKPLGSADPFDISPEGYVSPDLAVASLGDTLAVAWVDTLDPSAPTVVIQLVGPDGTLGPATSIPTNEAWFSGGLRLLASPDTHSLLVSWTGPPEQGSIAVARVDCVQGL